MKVCHRRTIPVTAYSGGTSLEGHFAATRGGICIDFSRMDKVLALHKEDLDVVVQPAVGWELLNEELSKENLFFPPDPGPGATVIEPVDAPPQPRRPREVAPQIGGRVGFGRAHRSGPPWKQLHVNVFHIARNGGGGPTRQAPM